MSTQPPLPQDSNTRFDADIDSLASAITERPALAVEKGPQTIHHRTLYWGLAAFCALIVGSVEMWILTRDDAPPAPAPPAAVVAVLDEDPCAQRLVTAMQAVDAYAAASGSVPPSLETLPASSLAGVPRGPAGGAPLRYERDGDGVVISCDPSGG